MSDWWIGNDLEEKDETAWTESMISEWWIGKDLEGKDETAWTESMISEWWIGNDLEGKDETAWTESMISEWWIGKDLEGKDETAWTESISEWWIGKDLQGSGRDQILRYYPGICLDGLRNTTNIKSALPVSGPRFEPGTSKIRSSAVNHSTTTFGGGDVMTFWRRRAIHCNTITHLSLKVLTTCQFKLQSSALWLPTARRSGVGYCKDCVTQ
jgi:hypothetical protein